MKDNKLEVLLDSKNLIVSSWHVTTREKP